MKFLIIFVLSGSLRAYSASAVSYYNPFPSEAQQLEQAQKLAQAQKLVKSVWMIGVGTRERGNDKIIGTAFFVSPRHVVTNWHVIHDRDISSLSLQRDGSGERQLFIKRLISVSAVHDLALLETEEASTSYLTVGKDPVEKYLVSSKEKLALLYHTFGFFRYTSKIPLFEEFRSDDSVTSFFLDQDYSARLPSGGGSVLFAGGEVVGFFVHASYYGRQSMIGGSVLREFIDGDIGLSCEGRKLKACVKEEMDSLQEQAERGSQTAQYRLAVMYKEGSGAQEDLALALEWLHRSAENGHLLAQYDLGIMYWLRLSGVQQDLALALKWLRRSAERGYAPAQFRLGIMYKNGLGLREDLILPLELYKNGSGVQQDLALAFEWFHCSAEQGYAPAQNALEEMKGRVRVQIALAVKRFFSGLSGAGHYVC